MWTQHLLSLMYLSQVIMQRLTLALILCLAAAGSVWSIAAAVDLAPWLELAVGAPGGARVEAGIAVQLGLTLFLLGLCYFIPMNARVMQLENSHRNFALSMWDVAKAYQAAHAADRDGVFTLKSEFDSVRDRLIYLRSHPDLGSLEPEVLEIAAQMSHESRELAMIYSADRVDRARRFLRQRQEEAEKMKERVQVANSTCREIKRWLASVEIEEGIVRSQLAQLKEELADVLPILDLSPAAQSYASVEVLGNRSFAAE